MKNVMAAVTLMLLSGCATLDAQSNFEHSIEDVKHFNGYSLVTSKSYQPDMVALKGAMPAKGHLYIIAGQSNQANVKAPNSEIKLEVMYLKNYSKYTSYTLNGQSQKAINELPVFETCSDLCMNTQYLKLPISNEDLQAAATEGLSFTLNNSNKTIVTQFDIAAGYIAAITDQFATEYARQTVTKRSSSAPVIVVNDTPSDRAEEMVKYWFSEASEAEKEQFLDWALMNRNNNEAKLESEIKAIEMTSYWYSKVEPERRKIVLTWLLNQ